jgi:superfamily II RNA helicase
LFLSFFPILFIRLQVKKSTGLAGIPVEPEGREKLIKLYEQILRDTANFLPPTATYRQALEKLYGRRLKILQECKDVEEVEKKLEEQVELLIWYAQDELVLLPELAKSGIFNQTDPYHAVPVLQLQRNNAPWQED